MTRALLAAAFAALLALPVCQEAAAQGRRKADDGAILTDHPRSGYYRKKSQPQVRGYILRRGGYSYSIEDSLNTYGSSRTLYGGSRFYRDSQLDRQTTSGPFDHGFFFDSGVAPRGGDSPYMH